MTTVPLLLFVYENVPLHDQTFLNTLSGVMRSQVIASVLDDWLVISVCTLNCVVLILSILTQISASEKLTSSQDAAWACAGKKRKLKAKNRKQKAESLPRMEQSVTAGQKGEMKSDFFCITKKKLNKNLTHYILFPNNCKFFFLQRRMLWVYMLQRFNVTSSQRL